MTVYTVNDDFKSIANTVYDSDEQCKISKYVTNRTCIDDIYQEWSFIVRILNLNFEYWFQMNGMNKY